MKVGIFIVIITLVGLFGYSSGQKNSTQISHPISSGKVAGHLTITITASDNLKDNEFSLIREPIDFAKLCNEISQLQNFYRKVIKPPVILS